MVIDKQLLAEQGLAAYSATRARMVSFKIPGVGKPATVFFTQLTLRLEPVVDWEQKTAGTDGEKVYFNPQWFLSLSQAHRFTIIAHEGYHPAMGHHARQGDREHEDWNIACDLAINPVLMESGFEMPSNAMCAGVGKYKNFPVGLNAETYYDMIRKPKQQGGGGGEQRGKGEANPEGAGGSGSGEGEGEEHDDDDRADDSPDVGGGSEGDQGGDGEPSPDGDGGGPGECPDPGGCGGVMPKPRATQPDLKADEDKWKVAVAQAAQTAKQIGQLHGQLERHVEEVLKPKYDCWAILHNFVSQFAKVEQSYARPNRRFLQQGIIMPTLSGQKLGELLVAVDCSGSISQDDLDVFAGNLETIAEMYECKLCIVYHDIPVTRVEHWEPSDGPLKLRPHGGGGTSHVDVMDWLNRYSRDSAHDPQCIVAFTDLYTQFPEKQPDLPVLWGVYGTESPYYKRPKAPWGTVCEIRN